MNEPCQATKEMEVPAALDRLEKAINYHEEQLDALMTRLQPVTKKLPPTCGEGGANKTEQMLCDLAEKIEQYEHRIAEQTRRIQGRLSHLEI